VTARQNITRTLRYLGLLDAIEITSEAEDRIYARVVGGGALVRRVLDPANPWTHDPSGCNKLHPGALESYREPGAVMPALQICFHPHGMVEIDLDLANPLGGDVVSAVVHAAEVFWHAIAGRKSNQQRIARMLDKRFKNA
jgi:hypothetical protein